MVTERGGRGLSKPWFAVLLFCVGMCWTVSGKESPRPQNDFAEFADTKRANCIAVVPSESAPIRWG